MAFLLHVFLACPYFLTISYTAQNLEIKTNIKGATTTKVEELCLFFVAATTTKQTVHLVLDELHTTHDDVYSAGLVSCLRVWHCAEDRNKFVLPVRPIYPIPMICCYRNTTCVGITAKLILL